MIIGDGVLGRGGGAVDNRDEGLGEFVFFVVFGNGFRFRLEELGGGYLDGVGDQGADRRGARSAHAKDLGLWGKHSLLADRHTTYYWQRDGTGDIDSGWGWAVLGGC